MEGSFSWLSHTTSGRAGYAATTYDHGLDFGPVSQKGYLQRARSFLNRNADGAVIQQGLRDFRWGDAVGDRVRYDVITQEFGIVTEGGYVRTYFIPEPSVHGHRTNLDYFLSQF